VVALSRTVASSSTGFLVELVGYEWFFALCVLLGVPGMLLLLKVAPWTEPGPPANTFIEEREAEPVLTSPDAPSAAAGRPST
jgi:predicted MFS family arabinose efflux permease